MKSLFGLSVLGAILTVAVYAPLIWLAYQGIGWISLKGCGDLVSSYCEFARNLWQ